MSASSDETTTLFRLGMEKFRALFGAAASKKQDERPALPDVFNPLGFRLGGYVRIESLALMDHTFSVEMISEFTRQIAKKRLVFTDYSLHDPGDGNGEGKWVTLRVIPEEGRQLSCFALLPHEELVFDKALIEALNGDEITDNATHVTYRKAGAYEATIREVSSDGMNRLHVKYWDHVNDERSQTRLHVTELDLSDREGVIQTYLGEPVSREDIKSVAGHV